MIEQYLSNTNEIATVLVLPKILELNKDYYASLGLGPRLDFFVSVPARDFCTAVGKPCVERRQCVERSRREYERGRRAEWSSARASSIVAGRPCLVGVAAATQRPRGARRLGGPLPHPSHRHQNAT